MIEAHLLMVPDVEVFEDRVNLFVGRFYNCALVIWRRTPTTQTAELAARYFDRFEHITGDGFALIAIITSECAPVGPDVREAFANAMRDYRDATLGMAAVIEVPGVLGGLTRALARTMSVVSRSPYPTHVFANPQAACAWLSPLLSQRGAPPVDQAGLEQFIRSHRTPPA